MGRWGPTSERAWRGAGVPANQETIRRHDYFAFGEDIEGPTGDPRRFTGKERDAETELHYFGARYYRSVWGRFTSVDPVLSKLARSRPQRWNRYAYALNGPLRFGDPTGLDAVDFGSSGIDDGMLDLGGWLDDYAWNDEYSGIDTDPQTGAQSQAPSQPSSDSSWLPALKIAADFSAGAGDCLTGRCLFFGTSLTEQARKWFGTDSVVSKDGAAYGSGELFGGTVGYALAASASATALAIRGGKSGALFGRGKNTLFNSSRIRFGWGWKGPAIGGRDVIRLGIGPAGGQHWYSHIIFWFPK